MRRIKVSEAVRGGRGKEGEQHISTPASRNLNLSKFRSLVIMVDAQKKPFAHKARSRNRTKFGCESKVLNARSVLRQSRRPAARHSHHTARRDP